MICILFLHQLSYNMEKNIQKLMANLKAVQNRAKEVRREEFGAEMEVRRALSERLKVVELGSVRFAHRSNSHPPCAAAIEIGHWDCDSSPIGICAYDGYQDPIHDNCLYCDHPEDRK